jgi:hypothetical protein
VKRTIEILHGYTRNSESQILVVKMDCSTGFSETNII